LFLIVHINHMASVILSMNASLIHLGFFLNCIDPSPLISSIAGCSHWVFGKVCSHNCYSLRMLFYSFSLNRKEFLLGRISVLLAAFTWLLTSLCLGHLVLLG